MKDPYCFPGSSQKIGAKLIAPVIVGICMFAPFAWAGQSEAQTAIDKATAKIELMARQASLATGQNDQSFNDARAKLDIAREAAKKSNYSEAEMMADEAALMADLSAEKAKLSALTHSRDELAAAIPSQ